MVRPARADFRRRARADCAVSARGPPSSTKALARRRSAGARLLDRRPPAHTPAPQLPGCWPLKWSRFPFHRPGLFTGFRNSESWDPTFGDRIAGSYRCSTFNFLRNFRSLSTVAVPIYLSPAVYKSSNFATPLSTLILSVYFIVAVFTVRSGAAWSF